MEINETGGVRIGFTHASRPFARLMVTKDKMELRASIIGDFVFRPSDVQALELAQGMIISGGVRIVHNVPGYKPDIVFITSSPASLIERIKQTGFLSNTSQLPPYVEAEIAELQSAGSFPLKLPAVIAIIIIWNGLLIPSFIFSINKHGNTLTPLPLPALLFLFFFGLAMQVSEPFSRLILKPGHSVNAIRSFLWFIMGISLFMSVIFLTIMHFAR